VCTSCLAGTYSTAVGLISNSCNNCPTLSNSLAASDELVDCQCNTGSTGSDGTPCTSCVAGKYKIATGDAVCTSCLAGKYRHPNFEYNWARSCGAARTDACPTAQSSISAGGAHQRAVDGNSNALWTGASCTHTASQHVNWWSVRLQAGPVIITGLRVRGREDCCDTRTANYSIYVGNDLTAAGRLQNNAVCVPAVAGRALTQFSADNLVCQQLIYGRIVIFSLVVPIVAQFLTLCEVEIWSPECAHCPKNSDSLPGSSNVNDCLCNAGWSGTSTDCESCVPGKYKPNAGSQKCSDCVAGKFSTYVNSTRNTCTDCIAGSYSNENRSVCLSCPINSFSSDQSDKVTACLCNAGWYGTSDDCNGCVPGKYKPNPGSQTCSDCVAGKYSVLVNSSMNTCIDCLAGSYSHENRSVCLPCPKNSLSPDRGENITACSCKAGWSGIGGDCKGCVPGKYKPNPGFKRALIV